MAEKVAQKSRWGKKKDGKEPQALPVLPVRRRSLDIPDAVCTIVENYYTVAECERYLEALKSELDWRKQRIEVRAQSGEDVEVAEPRLTLFMSDPGIFYEYSGRENEGVAWHPAVLEIKEKAERAIVDECGLPRVAFNAVQLNRYEGPRHALGFHADNEPDLAKGEPIASVSFGVTRDFVVMDRIDDSKKWVVPLSDGCFMVMGGDMQSRYLHGVPAGGDHGVRINLTFRVCVPRERGQGPAAVSRRAAAGAAPVDGTVAGSPPPVAAPPRRSPAAPVEATAAAAPPSPPPAQSSWRACRQQAAAASMAQRRSAVG